MVDGSVNLNHGDVVLALRVGRLHAVCVRDHAGGYRFATTIRRAEGNHYLAGDQLGGVTPGDGLQVQARGVNLQDRQVSGRVQAHYGCGAYGAVAQAHLNGGCFSGRFEGNHVVVGEDVAFLVEDNATTAAGGGAVRSNDSHGRGQDLLRGFCYACHGGRVADIGADGTTGGGAGGAVIRCCDAASDARANAAADEGCEQSCGEHNAGTVTLVVIGVLGCRLRRRNLRGSSLGVGVAGRSICLRVCVLTLLLVCGLVACLSVHVLQGTGCIRDAVIAAVGPSIVLSHEFS